MRLVCVLFTFENNTGHTDGRTDGRTDTTSYRDATAHLKIAPQRQRDRNRRGSRVNQERETILGTTMRNSGCINNKRHESRRSQLRSSEGSVNISKLSFAANNTVQPSDQDDKTTKNTHTRSSSSNLPLHKQVKMLAHTLILSSYLPSINMS